MTFKQLLSHPVTRVAQTTANFCFAAVFVWMAIKGEHTGMYLMLAVFAMTTVNIAILDARRGDVR